MAVWSLDTVTSSAPCGAKAAPFTQPSWPPSHWTWAQVPGAPRPSPPGSGAQRMAVLSADTVARSAPCGARTDPGKGQAMASRSPTVLAAATA